MVVVEERDRINQATAEIKLSTYAQTKHVLMPLVTHVAARSLVVLHTVL